MWAMDRRDDWRESDCTFFDASCTSDNEWNADAPLRADGSASDLSAVARNAKADARPSDQQGRVMVIGFSVIRL